MRPRRLLLRLLLLLPLAGLPAAAPTTESRKFTDAFGRSFTGTLIEAGDTQAKVRRDDGQVFTVELGKLSPEDAAFVAKWRKDRLSYNLRLEASQFHVQVGSNRSRDPATVDKNIAAGYDIKVTNAAPAPVAGLRVEYNVFAMRYNFETIIVQSGYQTGYPGGNIGNRGNNLGGNRAGTQEIQQIVRQVGPPTIERLKGATTLDLAAFKASPLIRTAPLNYFKHTTSQPAANGGSLDYETGELNGLWVRVLNADGRVVAEYVSNENLRAQGWQEVAAPVTAAAR
jgi:hypothetical protein